MGPGSPQPLTVTVRAKGQGSPLSYQSKANKVQSDVAKGDAGQNVAAQFEPRRPVRPPGMKGIGDGGSFVDAKA
jgi:hypothetical protein